MCDAHMWRYVHVLWVAVGTSFVHGYIICTSDVQCTCMYVHQYTSYVHHTCTRCTCMYMITIHACTYACILCVHMCICVYVLCITIHAWMPILYNMCTNDTLQWCSIGC